MAGRDASGMHGGMNVWRGFAVLTVLSLGFAASSAWAHARLVDPAPRNNRDGYKEPLAVANCGVARAATQPVTDIAAGSLLPVQFEETINHSGCFILDLSVGGADQNWMELLVVPHSTATGTPRDYLADVQLPAGVVCETCTLRLRQLMVSNVGCPPANVPAGDTYYSCANIRLVGVAAPDAGVVDADAGSAGASSSSGGAGSSTSAPVSNPGGSEPGGNSGCVCSGPVEGPAAAVLLGLGVVLFRRRRWV
jgi:MYXO-CTERM domain-containing protein